MVNLSGFIRFHAQRTPGKTALVYGNQRISYMEFLRRIERLGGWLVRQGVGTGDVVAVLMKNSAAFLEIAFATSHVGAVLLPVNYRLSAEEVTYIARDAGARLLLVDDDLLSRAGGVDRIVAVDADAQQDMGRLTGACAPAEVAVRWPDDLMRLMYTSGTTARPKGVMHSYGNFYWKNAAHQMEFGLSPDTRLLVTLPLYHVGAYDLPGIAVLWCGGTIVLHRDFDPQAVLAAFDSERITGVALVPVMTGMLLACPERDRYDVSSLRWVCGGGEKTPESRIRAFSDYFRNARYIDAYGLTESCSGDTFMAAGREIEKIGSAGRATLHVEIQIRSVDGEILPPGRTGEICLRGPKITRGYWNDPEKTRASFHGDWFRTGDAGHLDADGFLYLTDRIKDMIISGGENIASSEIERVIYLLPQVRDAAVIGVPDDHWGERPVAIVALTPGAVLDLQALTAHCRAHLGGFKVPKELLLVAELPRNATGKVLKRELRRMYADSSLLHPTTRDSS
ncbi:MAG: acyl-CoA synthetase [Comamonas sp. SCN 67-35]|uniref:AMP-binding protein n=1 Tax=unclassified Comamonas TaxID=2638500 RepID=UPI0008686501|nr:MULTISPECIES: AMP-binding protein [unclassified Comamonas]MBN9329027.1 AMP-binding protein [Comamonas sp.]ODU38719.1 MAG: acyl-CoA synthetase [Comamonas sp. SCN 67-35]OJX01859.1 MAG: acyl-CoA synthetase [Burkholderiales bacterium 66-26]